MRRTIYRPQATTLENRYLLNSAPIFGPLPAQFVQESKTFSVDITATDPDNDPITFSLGINAPADATINPTTGLFLWKPPELQQVVYIPILATDSNNNTTTGTLTVWIFDSPPTVNAGVNEITSSGQFARSGYFTDPNKGDTHTAIVDYGDGTGVQPLTLNSDNTFDLNHNYSRPGQFTVIVTIYDSQGGQGIGAFAVTVQDNIPSTIEPPPNQPRQNPSTITTVNGPNQNKQQIPIARHITFKRPRFHLPRFVTNLHQKRR